MYSWFTIAFLPAFLYTIQNMAALMAYQTLDSLTFNVLNQTKTLSAALCCYFIMGRRQSYIQVMALMLLLLAALVFQGLVPVERLETFIYNNKATSNEQQDDDDIIMTDNEHDYISPSSSSSFNTRRVTYGLIPIMIASFISGLAGALTQRNLQKGFGGKNSYMFSMELSVATILMLTMSLMISPDGEQITKYGFWYQWTTKTWIPILTNALGGVLVGLVTKHAGAVRKGFALITGMFLSGLVQSQLEASSAGDDEVVTKGQVVGCILAAISLYLHSTHPPSKNNNKSKQD